MIKKVYIWRNGNKRHHKKYGQISTTAQFLFHLPTHPLSPCNHTHCLQRLGLFNTLSLQAYQHQNKSHFRVATLENQWLGLIGAAQAALGFTV